MSAKEQKGNRRALRLVNSALGMALVLLIASGILVGCGVVATAPDVTSLKWDSSTVILDRSGKEVYRLHAGQNRTPVKLKQIPEHVRKAFLAIEDPNFEAHSGLDFRGIARAVWRSTLYVFGLPGGRLEGGSTITQQLARDAWLSQEISAKRKLQEAWVAIQLERHYTKDEILEMYLNQIYFGRGAYGIQAAAQTFFAKDTDQLTLAEGAQLAGMINGPSYFDPYAHLEDSIKRRNLVLSAMVKLEYITADEQKAAREEQPKLGRGKRANTADAGHFTDYVINILQKPGLAESYGLKLDDPGSIAKAGLRVHTTLDTRLQDLAEQAVADQMAAADRDYGLEGKSPRPEAAMVVMDPRNGEVLAMVGGRDRQAMLEFNRATDAVRQPGSAIKPFVAYVPALEAGLNPATILDDAPVTLTTDKKTVWPQNYDFKYLGLKSMRYAVEQSLNPVAVRAMQAGGGPARGADYARRFGLAGIGREDEHLALALGGVGRGVTPLEMTSAYATLANLGTRSEPVVITKIEDRRGNVIFEAKPRKKAVLRPATAYVMIDMLRDVVRKGTAYGFTGGFNGWPAAGKTGTTEENRDGWFVGFTPNLVVTVWNGYDDPSNHLKWTAAFVPVKTWNQFMRAAVPSAPADWPRPADVVTAPVCRMTGLLPNELCPREQIGTELFLKGMEPRTSGEMLVRARAVLTTRQTPDKKATYSEWQLWQPGCAGTPVERVFIRRSQPRVLHPTDPFNPRYVPADVRDELPTAVCQPAGSVWDRLIPKLPDVLWPTPAPVPVPVEPKPQPQPPRDEKKTSGEEKKPVDGRQGLAPLPEPPLSGSPADGSGRTTG